MTEKLHNQMAEHRRMAGGMTQQELAARVGVSRQTIIAIESGRYNPSVALALKLAQALLTDVENLFSLPEKGNEKSDKHADDGNH
jgi:putative transcriptional regulator